MKCRPATNADIPEMTRIITEGFLDYPFHVMLQPHLYRAEHYPQCLSLLNRMMAKAYVEYRNALVVEHEGDVVAVALMHDRPIGFWPNFFAGGYQLFRYGTPRLLMDFSVAADLGDQYALDAGDFDWYLETLSVDRRMRGRGVGRWLVAKVLPDFVAKRGGRAYGFVTSTESNARFYLNGGCELLDRGSTYLRGQTCPIWAFQKEAKLL